MEKMDHENNMANATDLMSTADKIMSKMGSMTDITNHIDSMANERKLSDLLVLIVNKLERTEGKLDKLVKDCAEIKSQMSSLQSVIQNKQTENSGTATMRKGLDTPHEQSNGSSHQKRPVYSPQISEVFDKAIPCDVSEESLDVLSDLSVVREDSVKYKGGVIRRENCTRVHRSPVNSHDSKDLGPKRIISNTTSGILHASKFPFDAINDRIIPDAKLFSTVKTTVESIVAGIVGPNTISVGSSYESLNVGRPFEFDIQWRIEGNFRFKRIGQKSTVTVYRGDTDDVVKPEIVRNELHSLIKNNKNYRLPSGWKWFQNDVNESMVLHKKGLQIALVFHDGRADIGVLLDIIPCFALPDDFVKVNDLLNSDSTTQLKGYFTFKGGSIPKVQLHLVFDNTTWRVSTSLLEQNVINAMDEKFKTPLRVIKYLFNTRITHVEPMFASSSHKNESLRLYGLDHMIPTYLIKNEFLKIVLQNHSQLNSIETADSFIANNIISKLEKVYPSQQMQSVRHFLLQNSDVKIITTFKQGEDIAKKLKGIKNDILDSKLGMDGYPLINFTESGK